MAKRVSNAKKKKTTSRLDKRAVRSPIQPKITRSQKILIQKAPEEKRYKRIIVSPRRHPKQQGQVESISGKRGIIRVTTDLTKCRTRKKYKKKMLKSIAAQMKRSGKGLSSWRRRRRQNTNIIYRC